MKHRTHTYSIVARDAESGQLGIGVQSRYFACGAVVPWAERGVGAVATQATVDTSYGRLGLALMRAGKSAQQALAALVIADPESAIRQVAMVDAKGGVAVHTGSRCVAHAGHIIGEGFSTQGNLLANSKVWGAMAEAFKAAKGDLSERLMQALEAGEDAGGDARGKQSAALIVVPGPDDPLAREMITNLRVDDSDHPLVELRRLLTIQRGYEWQAQAIHALERGNLEQAREYYGKLRGLVVGVREPHFWYAAALLEHGHVEEALPILAEVFKVEPVWRTLLDRLAAAGLFPNDPDLIAKVKAVAEEKPKIP